MNDTIILIIAYVAVAVAAFLVGRYWEDLANGDHAVPLHKRFCRTSKPAASEAVIPGPFDQLSAALGAISKGLEK